MAGGQEAATRVGQGVIEIRDRCRVCMQPSTIVDRKLVANLLV